MYYFWANDAQAGPYTLSQVRSMWNSGQINSTTLYFQEGMQTWGSLGEIVQVIENPTPAREAPRILETRKTQEARPITLPDIQRWLTYVVFGLALISFFLPIISATVPLFGNANLSMFDLLTSKPSNETRDTPSFNPRNSTNPPTSDIWKEIAENKESAGGMICAVSLLLLMGHYVLTIVWGFFTFALKQTYDFLTFMWLLLVVQFPILFLIGGQILVGGMKSKMAADLNGNPFAGLAVAMASSFNLQPGVVTWLLMLVSLAALALLIINRKRMLISS
jgi:hypothetical protein